MDEVVSVFFVWNLFDTIFPEKCKNEFIITGLQCFEWLNMYYWCTVLGLN